MNKYRISHAEYFNNLEEYMKGLDESTPTYGYNESKKLCKEPMNQLIKKYDLSNKKVFSLGPNFGHEEYWFYKNGCNLTFVDIDENKVIEKYLKTSSPSTDENSLSYFIGDASEYNRNYSECKYDVFYVSSFTPDELRRGKIQTRESTLFTRAINSLSYRLLRKRLLKTWRTVEPFMDLVLEMAQKNLKDRGLFIYQSYACGVDLHVNPHYIKLVKTQLHAFGVILLKVYCLKAVPTVSLTIGFKGNEVDVPKYLKEIENNKEITTFHGRHPDSKLGCEIVYEHKGH